MCGVRQPARFAAQVADLRGKIRALGSVNVSAIEEYKEVKARYDALVTR